MEAIPINLFEIRQESLSKARNLGFKVNPALPLLETMDHIKPKDHIVQRIFALLAVAASSYGFDRKRAFNWLTNENGVSFLTETEKAFLLGGQVNPKRFMEQIEAMWALCWTINAIPDLDFDKICAKNFVELLPDLKKMESGQEFLKKAELRNPVELLAKCDLAYCLSWSVRENGIPIEMSKDIKSYVITERRRGLEWIISDQGWDDISLDT
jgi:hypothetical protein